MIYLLTGKEYFMTTKKLVAIAAAFSLAVGGTGYVMPESNAATTLKLKNVSKKKTMYVGKKFTIKTNMSLKKLTFKSSKKSVATVNKKGCITAKKKGTCKITVTAKINKKKTSKKTITLTIKKKSTISTTAPKFTSTPSVDDTFTISTSEPSTTATPTVATDTTIPKATEAINTSTPEATAIIEASTEIPIQTSSPEVAATAEPTTAPSTELPVQTSTPGATTTEPSSVPATGTMFVTSIYFDETGVTLKDADDKIVDYKDASNMIVTDGNYVTITAPTEDKQEIVISGTCKNGQIKVDVDKDTYPKGEVDLSLEGLTLSNESDSPIYIASIDDICNITVKKGTENNISDGTSYTNADNKNGAIYSKDDLKIKGKGILNVTGNCGFGIFSKNDLKIFNGTINVTAQGVAIKGKDSVKFGDKDDIGKDGAFDNLNVTLTSKTSDGVRSTNPKDDETKLSEDKDYGDGKEGEIIINGGTLKITSYGDALQSSGDLTVNGGTVDLYTYQGSSYSSSNNSNDSWGFFPGRPTSTTTTKNEVSAKGLKADGKLTINDGSIVADCSDDTLHCAETATIKGGTLTLATGDDGIHSDSELVIKGGKVNITKSYEGIEAPTITVNDGTIHVVSSDDGFNASDGSGEAAMGNGGFGYGGPNDKQMWGGNTDQTATSTTTCELYINGGYCIIEAEGDGIDSNGNLHITGGTTLVIGPSMGGNGSFDIGDNGGIFEYTGGTVMAVGSSDMAVFPSDTSSYLTRSLSTNGENTIAITDANNKVLSVLRFHKSAQLLTYCNKDTDVANCKVYLNPEYDGTLDEFGYGTDGNITGGTEQTATSSSSSNNGYRPGRR